MTRFFLLLLVVFGEFIGGEGIVESVDDVGNGSVVGDDSDVGSGSNFTTGDCVDDVIGGVDVSVSISLNFFKTDSRTHIGSFPS